MVKRPESSHYRSLVRFMFCVSVFTSMGGALWLIGGAGIHGSPVGGAFYIDPLTGYQNYWPFWMMVVVTAGPIALLPCILLERLRPHSGAVAMIITGFLVAEAGIRASRMYWGFADADAQLIIACISAPTLLSGLALLILGSRDARRRHTIVGLLAVCFLAMIVTVRFQMVKQYWNANCPAELEHRL